MTNVQLCQVKKPERCGRLARFFSSVRGQFVCDRHADEGAVSTGYGGASGRPEVLTPVGGAS
jgi:hypothetical protein